MDNWTQNTKTITKVSSTETETVTEIPGIKKNRNYNSSHNQNLTNQKP